MGAWASADFFPGEGKIFQGGAKTYYLPKKHLKTYYFLVRAMWCLFLAFQIDYKCERIMINDDNSIRR